MNVIIVGAGVVGCHIAQYLTLKNHQVILVDVDEAKLKLVEENLDLKTLRGYGSDVVLLQQAGVDKAHLFLALTNEDEVNLLATQLAKKMGAAKVVARVSNRIYLRAPQFNFRSSLGIDLILSPELLTAIEIVRFMDNPEALTLAHFAQGRIRLHQVVVTDNSVFAHQYLKDLKLPSGVLVVLVSRKEEVIIPKGSTRLEPGDRITILGLHEAVQDVSRRFEAMPMAVRAIVIAGGGETGLFLAETLESKNYEVRLIESHQNRCRELSELLSKTTIIYGDATNAEFIKEERLNNTDVFVAVTGDDEVNIMSSLLMKELGVPKCVVKVDRPDYAELLKKFGIDLVLSPRHLIANKIVTLIKRGKITGVSILEEGKVEVIEFQALPGAPIVGKQIKAIAFPAGCLLSAVVHDNVPIIPHGTTIIQAGDTVIVIGLTESIEKMELLFQPEGFHA